jgi:hypothetical protein
MVVGVVLSVFLGIGFILWCCCVVSGRSSRKDEELEELLKKDISK